VHTLDERKSSWKARIPGDLATISWEAEILEDKPNTFISWCSLPGSTVDNAGEVTFRDAPSRQGTEMLARISYRLPAGDAGSVAGKLFNPMVERLVKEDLRRFKQLVEGGEEEIAPSGGISRQSKDNTDTTRGGKPGEGFHQEGR
jgi:uncharacterized membrane protein